MKAREGLQLLTLAFSQWNEHDAPRLGAAIAYYTLLSIAPLMIIIIAICGLVLGQRSAEQQVLDQAKTLLGDSGSTTLQMLIQNTRHQSSGVLATVIAIIALLFGASGVFIELQDSLNTIWDATLKTSSTWWSIVWQRLVSFGMVLGIGCLLLISLLCSAALRIIEKFFSNLIPVHPAILEIANVVVSVLAIAVLFALVFKYVPDVSITWRDVGIGAAVTAILFTIGKVLLAWYLSTAGVGSAYGAAGSLVAMVVWVYYSAQIFLYGAVFTRVYAGKYGSYAGRTRTKSAPVGQIRRTQLK